MKTIFLSGIKDILSVLCLSVFLSSLPFPLQAFTDDSELAGKPVSQKSDSPEPALLRVFNRPIAIYRANSLGYSPAQRVQMAEERINEQISKGNFQKITSFPSPDGTLIFLDDVFVLSILNGDVISPYETMDQVVERTIKQLENALEKVREQRSIKHNLIAVGLSLAGLAVFLFALFVIIRSYAVTKVKVHAFEDRLLEKLHRHSIMPIGYRFYILTLILRLIFWTLIGISIYSFLTFTFLRFPYTEPWGDKLGFYIENMISKLMLSSVDSIPNFFVIMIVIVIAHWLVQISKNFFNAVEKGEISVSWIDPEAARPTSRIVTSILWVLAIIMAYPYIPGSNSEAFKGIGVFLGLLISLGASGMVGQVIGGMVLMYSRSIKIGEIIQVGENFGKVTEIGFFATRLITPKHEEINIPNAVLMSTVTKNYSRLLKSKGVILNTSVTIGYDVPWRQVHALLIRAADGTAGLAKKPEPFVIQKALSDFYVEYELNAYLETPDRRLLVLSELHARIQDQFNEFGVQIMSPHFEAQPEGKVYAPKEKWNEAPAPNSKSQL